MCCRSSHVTSEIADTSSAEDVVTSALKCHKALTRKTPSSIRRSRGPRINFPQQSSPLSTNENVKATRYTTVVCPDINPHMSNRVSQLNVYLNYTRPLICNNAEIRTLRVDRFIHLLMLTLSFVGCYNVPP